MKNELTDMEEAVIDRWISAVETGNPDGDYGNVTRLYDGPGGRKQLTYGKHQTTESGRNVQKLIKRYLDRDDAKYKDNPSLVKFVDAPTYSMVDHRALLDVLKLAGDDPAMHDAQNEFFLEVYMEPARKWARDNGFKTALSMLVIYDSFIQSGGVPSWLRKRFGELPPAKGGDEKAWTTRYVDVRHQWLKNWGNPGSADKAMANKAKAIRSSSYRTDALNTETDRFNWDLTQRPMKVNGITVATKTIPKPGGAELEPIPKATTCPTCHGSGQIFKA